MHFRRWQHYEKVWVAGGGQTVINFIILYIFIRIVAKEDSENSTVAGEIGESSLSNQLDYKVGSSQANININI